MGISSVLSLVKKNKLIADMSNITKTNDPSKDMHGKYVRRLT